MLGTTFIPVRLATRLRSRLYGVLCLAKICLPFCLALIASPAASGDVGVVLNESLDEDMDRISSTGHSAVYFSRICPESRSSCRESG